MTFAFAILASGSAGNATALVRRDGAGRDRTVLIDCGLSPRATAKRLQALGVAPDSIAAILLTHLDHDHFHRGWPKALHKTPAPVFMHRRHRNRAVHAGLDGRWIEMFDDAFEVDDLAVTAHMLAHDSLGTVGFRIEHGHASLGYATDLGHVPASLTRRFAGVDALALESNYDPHLQRTSDRPEFLKQRIMNGRGHLSNEEAVDAVLAIAAASPLEHVVPLHLSRQCNDPSLVRDLFARRAPHLLDRLTISSQREPTPLLHVRGGGAAHAGSQLGFAWNGAGAR